MSSNPTSAHLESQKFQEMDFLTLIDNVFVFDNADGVFTFDNVLA